MKHRMQTRDSNRGVRKLPDRVGRPNPFGVQYRKEGKRYFEIRPSS